MILLSAYGIGPLASSIEHIGTRVVMPGPDADPRVRERIVEGLLEGIAERGGVPLQRALVGTQRALQRIDGEMMVVTIWTASIAYAL